MNAVSARTTTALVIGLVLLSATACSQKAAVPPVAQTPATAETTIPSAVETPPATVETSATTVTSPPSTPATTPPTPKPTPTVALGPTDAAVSWAYLKDMYLKDGVYYIVVDYIQVVGPEETIHFVNDNPRLRTFPLSKTAKLLLLTGTGGPTYKLATVAQFKTFEAKSGDEVVEVTPKAGYAIQLKEWWAP